MADIRHATADSGSALGQVESEGRRAGWLAFGGILSAFIASTCCIVPLALVMLGVSGAWIGNLTALEPFKPYFLVVTAVALGFGFWYVYVKPAVACEDGSYCARPNSSRITKSLLWVGTLLAILSATISLWAPFFY